jgi:sugar O-acyltransferase (sialic acid O-acetyltransferase NeuD family)
MSRKIAFVGFGDLGKQFEILLSDAPTLPIDQVVYFDDNANALGVKQSEPFSNFLLPDYQDFEYYVALGYKHLSTKQRLMKQLDARQQPTFVHASCFVSPSAILGKGVFVYPMCNLDKGVKIGDGCLLNNSVVVSHDSVLGECCYLSPGVILSGQVTVGACTFIGTGSVVSNGINIGSNVTIGIGSVITRDVPDNSQVIGNPMKILTKTLEVR